MKQHGSTLSHRFLSHPAVDQLLIHWQQWASLTLSICGFWMGTVDTLLILFPEGCALLILHSDFSIHTDTSHCSSVYPTPNLQWMPPPPCVLSLIFSHSYTQTHQLFLLPLIHGQVQTKPLFLLMLLSTSSVFNSFSCSKDQLMLVKTGLCRLVLLWCWYCISETFEPF